MAAAFRVVGIGASAGGVEALRGFFQHWPIHNGAGVVVVLHMSPNRNSMLAEILGAMDRCPSRTGDRWCHSRTGSRLCDSA